jgi:hypothetical protein
MKENKRMEIVTYIHTYQFYEYENRNENVED